MTITHTSRNALGMPLLGFGTYQLATEQAETCVRDAIQAGFRHIDSAEGYNNEEGTGRGIKASGIARNELFITTKLFPGYQAWGSDDKTYDDTIATLKRQLTELQVDYVDLYLIHAPMSALRLEQWKACIALKEQGLAKHIGVANYNTSHIDEIINAGLAVPEANQIEFHPLCTQTTLTPYMEKHSIAPIAYSSLAPLSSWRTDEGQGGEVLAEIKQEGQVVIKDIATKLGVTEAQLLLRWGMQRGYGVLTKSSKIERIRENLAVFNFDIGASDMDRLNALNKGQPIAWAANGLNPMEASPELS